MKACISNKHKSWKKVTTGKGYFIKRLIKEFTLMGIEVTADPEAKADLCLGIGKFLYPYKRCKKKILRLGDAHKSTTENYKKLNKRKAKAVKIADGVIYQSKYSKKLCNAFLGKARCPTEIIFNGADPKEFDVEPHESPYKYNFIACTRTWTRQKRIHQIWDAFLEAKIPWSCLWIVGKLENRLEEEMIYDLNRAVMYLEKIDHKRLASLYRLCNAMVDTTYLSACPNAVVEALVAGVPVICTDQGGTHELLNGPDTSMKDKKYKFKPVNLNKPPKIDIKILSTSIKASIGEKKLKDELPTMYHLYISTIAQQYKKFFERILHG